MIELLQHVMLYLQPDSIWACPRSRPRWSGCSGTRCARRALKGCTAASCPTSAKSRPPSPSPTTSMKERESTLESKWSKNWKSSLFEAHKKNSDFLSRFFCVTKLFIFKRWLWGGLKIRSKEELFWFQNSKLSKVYVSRSISASSECRSFI